MDKRLYSFFGGISYLGFGAGEDAIFFNVRVAGRDIQIPCTDPGMKFLELTNGRKRFFLVVEETPRTGLLHLVAIYDDLNDKQARAIQELIGNSKLQAKDLADEEPKYLSWGL